MATAVGVRSGLYIVRIASVFPALWRRGSGSSVDGFGGNPGRG
jgi:hypothetical protein